MYRESEGREDREREKMKELERELVKGEIWEYREIVQRVGLFFFLVGLGFCESLERRYANQNHIYTCNYFLIINIILKS